MRHGADSTPQRLAQNEILEFLNKKHGWSLLAEQAIPIAGNRVITLDGLDRTKQVAVEVSAHIGKRSSSRDHKILQDAARLLLVRQTLGPEYRLLIALCDAKFHSSYGRTSKKWHAGYLEMMGIEVELVPISEPVAIAVREAQIRQQTANVRGGAEVANGPD